MREIVLDTETTGFDAEKDDRIVEIGAIELINHLPSGNTYHVYINPERPMPAGAFEVHGLGDEFLRDKPKFAEIADEFLRFIGDRSSLVIHNASFDMKFLNAELKRAGHSQISDDRAVDTLMLARKKFPGSPASLDALCRRFGIDNSNRQLHGALLDSELLAEVYLELIGGRQPDLVLHQTETIQEKIPDRQIRTQNITRPHPLSPRLTDTEITAHARLIGKIGENSVWKKYSG